MLRSDGLIEEGDLSTVGDCGLARERKRMVVATALGAETEELRLKHRVQTFGIRKVFGVRL